MTRSFWHGRRVFLTGHTGFKGSWLALWLNRLGARVYGYALTPPTEPNLFTLAHVAFVLEHQIADVRDLDSLIKAVASFAPDILIHMAAQPLVRASYDSPIETYTTNVMGTAHVLEAVRMAGSIRATLIVTSDKAYENHETARPYRETDPMGGFDPYSSSKGCAELVAAAYGRSYFRPSAGRGSIASVRAGNVIGGGDWAKDRLIADLMRGLFAGEKAIVRNPRAVRPWQHVLEPLSGYLLVAQRLIEKGSLAWEAWNFGPDASDERPVEEVARLTCRLWGREDALIVREDPDAVHEAGILKLDSSKARTILGWGPRWNFQEAIRQTVEWYRALKGGADMNAMTMQQIEAYESAPVLAR